jgi:hypothetical protein
MATGIATRPGRPLPGQDFHLLEQRTLHGTRGRAHPSCAAQESVAEHTAEGRQHALSVTPRWQFCLRSDTVPSTSWATFAQRRRVPLRAPHLTSSHASRSHTRTIDIVNPLSWTCALGPTCPHSTADIHVRRPGWLGGGARSQLPSRQVPVAGRERFPTRPLETTRPLARLAGRKSGTISWSQDLHRSSQRPRALRGSGCHWCQWLNRRRTPQR